MISIRIKELRKALHLTQTEFGTQLGVSRDVVGNLELGRVDPSDLIINMMCAKFSVDEIWLRTGDGEMFRKSTRDEKIVAFIGEALADKDDTFRADVVELLADLDAEDWRALKALAEKFISKQKKEGG